tara:strand:- start:507 stop:1283 length:777 start_codon:yes stop_codon:yes gene_type:complete
MVNIFRKILNTLSFRKLKKNYDFNFFVEDQNNKFKLLGFNRKQALEKLSIIKKKYDFLDRKMSTEHETLLSALSYKMDMPKIEILEIGTYDGANSFLLSILFQNSNITTIDLPDDNEEFIKTYERQKNLDKFIRKRDEILSDVKNIEFVKTNSINLIKSKKKFDIIWIDGAHGYPTICIDIINSFNMLNENGIALCDDVFLTKPLNEDQVYRSIGAFQTLKTLEDEKLISLNLFYKRLDVLNNCDPLKRKFIALFTKT